MRNNPEDVMTYYTWRHRALDAEAELRVADATIEQLKDVRQDLLREIAALDADRFARMIIHLATGAFSALAWVAVMWGIWG